MNIRKKVAAVLSCGAILGGLAVIPSAANAAGCTTFYNIKTSNSRGNMTGLPLSYAMDTGIDKQFCINFTETQVLSGAQNLALLAGSAVDIAPATLDNVFSWRAVSDMTIFREMMQVPLSDPSVTKTFYDANNLSKLKSFKEKMQALSSARLGVTSVGGAGETAWKQAFIFTGVEFKGTFVGGATNTATIGALMKSNSIDAAWTNSPYTEQLEAAGLSVPNIFNAKNPSADMVGYIYLDIPGYVYVGRTAWIRENPDAAKAVDALMDESIKRIKDPKYFASVVANIVKNLGVDEPTSQTMARRWSNFFNLTGKINDEAWNRVAKWNYENGLLKVLYNVNDFLYDVSASQIKPIKVKGLLAFDSLVKQSLVKTFKGSKLSISTRTLSICSVSTKGVVGKKPGVCDVTVTVKDPKKLANFDQERYSRVFITIK